jgi:hypothetical protein
MPDQALKQNVHTVEECRDSHQLHDMKVCCSIMAGSGAGDIIQSNMILENKFKVLDVCVKQSFQYKGQSCFIIAACFAVHGIEYRETKRKSSNTI